MPLKASFSAPVVSTRQLFRMIFQVNTLPRDLRRGSEKGTKLTFVVRHKIRSIHESYFR